MQDSVITQATIPILRRSSGVLRPPSLRPGKDDSDFRDRPHPGGRGVGRSRTCVTAVTARVRSQKIEECQNRDVCTDPSKLPGPLQRPHKPLPQRRAGLFSCPSGLCSSGVDGAHGKRRAASYFISGYETDSSGLRSADVAERVRPHGMGGDRRVLGGVRVNARAAETRNLFSTQK